MNEDVSPTVLQKMGNFPVLKSFVLFVSYIFSPTKMEGFEKKQKWINKKGSIPTLKWVGFKTHRLSTASKKSGKNHKMAHCETPFDLTLVFYQIKKTI